MKLENMPVIALGSNHEAVAVARAILNSQGYLGGKGNTFDAALRDEVISFQAAHVGPDGKPLKGLGQIGPKTWWALANPSGPAQRAFAENHNRPLQGMTSQRRKYVVALIDLWESGVREIPDGSNWGDGVTKILANAGGPRPWCCHTISHAYHMAFGEYPYGKDWGHVRTAWLAAEKKGMAYKKGSGYEPKPGDLGVTLYRNDSGSFTGAGHIWTAVSIGPKAGQGRNYNHIGGNEGNRLKMGIRNTADESLYGWINLFADDDLQHPDPVAVLPYQTNVEKAKEALHATR